jgi:hypothetical protein
MWERRRLINCIGNPERKGLIGRHRHILKIILKWIPLIKDSREAAAAIIGVQFLD